MTQTKRCLVTFQPQAWIRDNAVDVDGAFKFDVTEQVLALGREAALALKDDSEESDRLWYDAGMPTADGVTHNGPFVVRCEAGIAAFLGSPVRDMYTRLARAYEDEPVVPDRGGGVPGDRFPL